MSDVAGLFNRHSQSFNLEAKWRVHDEGISDLAATLDISSVLQRKIEADLQRRAPELSRARMRITVLVLETCIEALCHRAVVETPDWLETGQIEQEAQRLLEPYIGRALTSGHA